MVNSWEEGEKIENERILKFKVWLTNQEVIKMPTPPCHFFMKGGFFVLFQFPVLYLFYILTDIAIFCHKGNVFLDADLLIMHNDYFIFL